MSETMTIALTSRIALCDILLMPPLPCLRDLEAQDREFRDFTDPPQNCLPARLD